MAKYFSGDREEAEPKMSQKVHTVANPTTMHTLVRVNSEPFSEDYDLLMKKHILDPRGPLINKWNKLFLVASLVSLYIDPLYCFVPYVKEGLCIESSSSLEISLTVIRSLVDAFYMVNVCVKFRTAYGAPDDL